MVKDRCWSKTGVCHISLSIQQILIKFTAPVYCMKILQIVKFDLICIMVAMVTDESLFSVNGFSIKHIPINLLALGTVIILPHIYYIN